MPKNLKALRESLNLQQKEFCEPFGIKPNTYSNYEIGITEPKISFWRAVAERYHVTLDFLLDFTDDPHGSKYGDDFILSLSEKNLVEAWRRADEKALISQGFFHFLHFSRIFPRTEKNSPIATTVAIRKRPGDPGRSLIFAAFGGMRRTAVDSPRRAPPSPAHR